MNTVPLPSIPSPPSTVPADIIANGVPIPAIDRLRLMSPTDWEIFILEWADSLKEKYQDVQRCGGAGDMGRDVVGFEIKGQPDPWDNYQCKHYNHALQPADIWRELGKLCYYTFIKQYTFPRNYFFVAPQGVGPALLQLLNKPASLKRELIEYWDDQCKKRITSTREIPLDKAMKAHIEELDFGRINAVSPLKIIAEHQKTRWHAARFGGGLPQRPESPLPPVGLAAHETTYIRALLDAYEERLQKTITDVTDLTEKNMSVHLERARREFYCAEALKEFSKDNVPQGTYDHLLEDVHDGIIDVVELRHADAYERVLAAVKQAKLLSLSSNALVSRINSYDKGGMCHQLANSEVIKWRP